MKVPETSSSLCEPSATACFLLFHLKLRNGDLLLERLFTLPVDELGETASLGDRPSDKADIFEGDVKLSHKNQKQNTITYS